MKPTAITLLLVPIAVLGSPTPNQGISLAPRVDFSDKTCSQFTNIAQGCDTDRYNSKRKVTVNPGQTFGVRCWSYGQSVQGNTVWDYVPGWDCWISALWTNTGCESMFFFSFLLSQRGLREGVLDLNAR
ncbi:hypothetical protein BCR34DRAFT_591046 [Clohesyomyces aquaticus]|uniref:Uncharacterized protein n=1 Tax=Clohesyomyces aquaticus TaxID=1231657 RepID=A0A1Y1Z4R1_9PLEO|nr:hypothetical protein BCR34DRAFT_591046 [Clohesyomyces aquaticus]